MINEARIRDSLANQLHLIERGLKLEGIESPLKNFDGAGGRLDIYARDQFNHHVIIEVKRSNKSAREAIHELYKYISLFREKYGINENDIRCIIVSTEWKELLLAFSTFVFDTDYEVSGYKLTLSEDYSISGVEKISPIPKSKSIAWRDFHSIFYFEETQRRDIFISSLIEVLEKLPGTEFACIPMNYDISREDNSRLQVYRSIPGTLTEVVFPFALYMAMTLITPKYVESIKLIIDQTIFQEIEDISIEEAMQIYINRELEGKYDEYELGYNSKFSNMLHTWLCLDAIRVGEKISNRLFYLEDDISENIRKGKGEHPWIYIDTVSPKFESRWNLSKQKIFKFLENNSKWREIVINFLSQFDGNSETIIKIYIYNPCNIIKGMYEVNFNFEKPCVPRLEITVEDFNGYISSGLAGCIIWDGSIVNIEVIKMIESIFMAQNSFSEFDSSINIDLFRIFVQFGQIREFEINICEMYNLTYAAVDFVIENEKVQEKDFFIFEKAQLVKKQYFETNFHSFEDFCSSHTSYINHLAELLDGRKPFNWEDRDYYCVDYFEAVQEALRNETFVSFSNIQPPIVQYGIGIIERADLVLQYLQSGDYSKEDKILRRKIIDTFILLSRLHISAVEKHLQLSICVFGYHGLLCIEDKLIKKMWKIIRYELRNSDHISDKSWLENLIDMMFESDFFSSILNDRILYSRQELERKVIFQKLNSDYSKFDIDSSFIRKFFDLGIL